MFPLKNTRKNSLGIQTTNCLNSQPEHCCLKERGCLVQLQRFSNTCLDISVMGLVWTSQYLTRQLQKHGVTGSLHPAHSWQHTEVILSHCPALPFSGLRFLHLLHMGKNMMLCTKSLCILLAASSSSWGLSTESIVQFMVLLHRTLRLCVTCTGISKAATRINLSVSACSK